MRTSAQQEGGETADEQLQRELQLLIQRHAEFSRRLEAVLAQLPGVANPTASGVQKGVYPAALPANVSKDLARLNDRISRMEEQFDALWRQLGINSARIQEIIDSRIWRVFTAAGGVLLRLTGRGRQ